MTLKTYIALGAAVLALAACSNKKECDKNSDNATVETSSDTPSQVTYTGTLPAADADGLDYTLVLNYTSDTDGDYTLTETVVGQNGQSFNSNGNFTVHTTTPAGVDQAFIKLTPAKTDRATDLESASDAVYYFIIASDSTITMTGADLVIPDTPLNYTLTRTAK